MIVFKSADGLRFITQTDHARFAGELLSLWRASEMAEHPRRDELLFAVREHDNGWRESDAAPRVDPASGRPHDFLSLPAEPRRRLWDRGIDRYRRERPQASALILEHALRLHEARRREPGWGEWLDSLAETRRELLDEAELDPAAIDADYPWLELADRVSLAICRGIEERFHHGDRRFVIDGGGRVRIEPSPLAGATTCAIPMRLLPRRRYTGDADLGGELATARWERVSVRITGDAVTT